MGDYAGRTFEYVTKTDLKLVKIAVEKIIKELQQELKKEKVTFQPKVIGSGSRNLVTKVKNGNTGFDFDYNFSLQKDGSLSEKELKLTFINKLEEVIKKTQYKSVSNGTTSFAIKVVDVKNSKVKHSCDFAIVNDYTNSNGVLCQAVLVRDKSNVSYYWNEKPSRRNFSIKAENIKANGLWGVLKEEYLKLKNNNQDKDKKSFNLYHESINNVYNRYEWV